MKYAATKTERDRAVIMAVVRRFGPVSRVDIHELTQLRPSTISLLVRGLIEEGKLAEAGTSNNPLGRKQVLLKLNEEHGFVLGIEFDPDFVTASTLSLRPHLLSMVEEETYLDGGREGLVEQLLACAHRALKEAGLEGRQALGIGFADAGLIDSRRGMALVSAYIDFWRDIPLREIFEKEFKAPFMIDTNTRCRAMAERVLGAGEMAEDLVYIDYRAGMGAGVFSGGTVLRGRGDSAGEVGHTHVMEDGPPCKCGSFGCLDAVAGAAALGARARKALEQGATSQAVSLAGSIAKVTGWTVLEAFSRGDKMCSSLVEDVGNYLGLGIANLVNLFNPSVVVLSSRLKVAGTQFLDQIVRIVKRQALPHATDGLVFRYGSLGDEAGVLGAGLLVLEHVFEIPALKPPKYLVTGSPEFSHPSAD